MLQLEHVLEHGLPKYPGLEDLALLCIHQLAFTGVNQSIAS